MRRVVIDKKEYYVTTMTPIQIFISGERSVTVAKVFINGKEYTLTVNGNSKGQMK